MADREKGEGHFRGSVAGEYATPSKMGREDSKYFGEGGKGAKKVCPERHRGFVDFATIAPSDDELLYYCPHCDALVAREFDDNGSRKAEVYDWDHVA